MKKNVLLITPSFLNCFLKESCQIDHNEMHVCQVILRSPPPARMEVNKEVKLSVIQSSSRAKVHFSYSILSLLSTINMEERKNCIKTNMKIRIFFTSNRFQAQKYLYSNILFAITLPYFATLWILQNFFLVYIYTKSLCKSRTHVISYWTF